MKMRGDKKIQKSYGLKKVEHYRDGIKRKGDKIGMVYKQLSGMRLCGTHVYRVPSL